MAVTQIDRTKRYEDLTAAELVGHESPDGTIDHEVLKLALDLEHQINTLPIDPKQITADMRGAVLLLRWRLEDKTGVKVLLHVLHERSIMDPNDQDKC